MRYVYPKIPGYPGEILFSNRYPLKNNWSVAGFFIQECPYIVHAYLPNAKTRVFKQNSPLPDYVALAGNERT